jgi:signal transduction histidine kinase/ligand-binding sensor domain-containing protein/AraC-like DNA-binding protein
MVLPHHRAAMSATACAARHLLVSVLAMACSFAVTLPARAQQDTAFVPDLSRWEGQLIHEAWTTKDGLPVNSINALLQSRDGYLWIGTFDGLVRFDGFRFTVFNSTKFKGLPSNRITRLFEDRDGTLWIITDRDLVRFRNGRFSRIGPGQGLTGAVRRVYQDRSGRLWVFTSQGLGWLKDGRFVLAVPDPLGSSISLMIQRRDGSIWVAGRGNGLYRLTEHPDTSTVDVVRVAAFGPGQPGALFEDPSGRLWVGTTRGVWTERNGGFAIVESERPLRSVLHFVYSSEWKAVVAYCGSGVFRLDGDRAVAIDPRGRVEAVGHPVAVDSAGGVWYATDSELGHDGRTALVLGSDAGDYPTATSIKVMLIDREESIWLGTSSAGLHRVRPSLITTLGEPEGLSFGNVYPVYQDPDGDVWVGTWGNGLNRIDRHGSITAFLPTRGYPASIRTLFADRADRLWVGAVGGVFKCSLRGMHCVRDESVPNQVDVFAFFRDSKGQVWGASRTGPMRYEKDRWVDLPGWQQDAAVRVLAETGDGAIWMGTTGGGLVRYRSGTFTRVTAAKDGLPLDAIRALYVDADGWLWVGTEGRGLARLDPLAWSEGSGHTDRHIVSIRAADGLFDETIHQILEDDAGRLWMSTNRGIFWVPREELNAFAEGRVDRVRSTAYTTADGLRSSEANGGVQPAGMRDRDGRLWFPTQDGVAIIDPHDVVAGRPSPPVVVEGVVAGDRELVPGDTALELGVDQRDLEVDYTALSFLEPANTRFRYRLDPYDTHWVEAGSRRSAFYTRVPPGRYTFRVMASVDPGVWTGAGASLDLVFAPRFRETRTAFLLAMLSLGLLVVLGYRWRVGSLRRREHELSLLVETRTADLKRHEEQLQERNTQLASQTQMLAKLHEARSRLFANLSHELRTPLTLVLGPLRSLLTGRYGPLNESVQDQHSLMLRNGERLLSLINQILDLSRLQAGALSLKLRTADLVGFARTTAGAFSSYAERYGIELRFEGPVRELRCTFDPEQLEKVLLNLLSNAVKFTEPGGAVVVEVRAAGATAEILVRDTGLGIAPDELPRIFDRFYQADSSSTRRYPGTGIGLALAKELVDLHGGEIFAESTLGEGSTFTVRLPVAGPEAAPTSAGLAGDDAAASREQRVVAAPLPVEGPDPATAGPSTEGEDGPEDRTTVLVVDDNADVRAYIRSVLHQTYSMIEARDGEEGLETARAALPDLIVADVMMPQLDGLALGLALKEDPMTDAIPLVLLTARAAPEDHVAGLEHGADAYLVKPFHPEVLEACVANLLEQRRLLRERFRQGEATLPATTPDPQAALDRRLRPLVEACLADPDFGPNTLAQAADLSYHQLYRALRDELGVTPSGFIRRIRVECAAELLRQGAGSVTEIAYSVGFDSLSYFRRAFHERFDASPTEYLAGGKPPAGPPPSPSRDPSDRGTTTP